MLIQELKKVFIKDLQKSREEIALYKNEATIWQVEKGIANSAGNLCLHLVGNLNHFIGATLGNTGYVRNREQEFLQKNIAQQHLLKMVDDTIAMMESVLSRIQDAQLDAEYPLLVFKEKTSTGYFLIHLVGHLGYHVGQINYHRRLLENNFN
ncbi:MAG: DinB family protein [Cyclobacteriaceae bacterium]|nr:DinB family protein [Cyclobacteriaceae bacterium]